MLLFGSRGLTLVLIVIEVGGLYSIFNVILFLGDVIMLYIIRDDGVGVICYLDLPGAGYISIYYLATSGDRVMEGDLGYLTLR